MAFWDIFRKKKKEEKKELVAVKCNNCGASYDEECDGLGTMSTGYKGRISFYTRCKHCEEMIYIDENKLSKKCINNAYKNHVWG